ncbi:hypothetical protein CAEBREN_15679 [Caenorhabditis brenneri]|uniref:Uncharacterized protein n=1 Tax=Caenorhabditis brenneri TaxID=135651 RepID=G0MDA4_CAEBE|nr:hypothetical protein CAEBREN_15679 [Caenorhabditis brenneri]
MVPKPESGTLVPAVSTDASTLPVKMKQEKSSLQIFMMTRQKLRKLYELERLFPSVFLEEKTKELEKNEEVKYILELAEQVNKDNEFQRNIESKAAAEKKIAMERAKEKLSERKIIHPESRVRKATKKLSPLVTAPEFVYVERKRVNVCYLRKLLIEIQIENEKEMKEMLQNSSHK